MDDRNSNDVGNALALIRAGQHRAAETILRQVLSRDAGNLNALNLLGACLYAKGDFAQAIETYRRVIRALPRSAAAHNNLGGCLRRVNQLPEAIEAFTNALRLDPGMTVVHRNLALVLENAGRLDEAIDAIRKFLSLEPNSLEGNSQLGDLLLQNRQYPAAVEAIGRAIRLNPKFSENYTNLGVALRGAGKYPEAAAAFKTAISLNPKDAKTVSNLGLILTFIGPVSEAIALHKSALELAPADPSILFNNGVTHMMLGDFERGWPGLEYRVPTREFESRLRALAPRWDGRDITGKTLLLAIEQGYGDLIQFVRYLPLVAQTGANLILECPGDLRPLFEKLPHVHRLIFDGSEVPKFDFYLPLTSAAKIFNTTPHSIPPIIPLHPPPELIEKWKTKLGPPTGRKRIGIAWAGNPIHRNDHNRSIRFKEFIALTAPEIEFFSLQKGPAGAEAAGAPAEMNLVNIAADISDYADTAAIIENLDLVICVDTSVAHLAGTLSKAVWVLLPFEPDWRWMLNRSDSPWYPTMKLFRQKTPGDWAEVIQQVRDALLDFKP